MDRYLPWLVGVLVFAFAAPGVLRYGLTWDEPTYLRFAGLQRGWMAEVLSGVLHPGKLPHLLDRATIHDVWLQHPERNGHPPLNELWIALAGLPFRWAGAPDLATGRLATSLLLALTALLLFLLLRQGVSRAAALTGVLVYIGVPAVWAHGHLGATETLQNLFWVLLAWLLPRVLRGGKGPLWLWTGACALSFMAKFTNILIPVWALGTAGLLGEWRRPRFWLCAFLAFIAGPLLILFLDPFFWPWQGGLARFGDYLRQVTTRAHWVPISVFYMGRSWGFHPPWHYRLVQTLATIPVAGLLLALTGIGGSGLALARGLRRLPDLRGWPQILGVTGLLFTLAVGWLPGTPNHDGTRQFVYVFVGIALLAGTAADRIIRWIRRRFESPGAAFLAALSVLCLGGASFWVSLWHEPWGLSYYSEWIGGARGAFRRGFELTYWCETFSPSMIRTLAGLAPQEGTTLRVHTVPKVDYFSDGADCLRAFLPPEAARRSRFARDVVSALFAPWAKDNPSSDWAPVLACSFQSPPDAILISYRRATVGPSAWNLLDAFAWRGELVLRAETVVDGVPLARLYSVPKVVAGRIPADPKQETWYQIPAVAERMKTLVSKGSAN